MNAECERCRDDLPLLVAGLLDAADRAVLEAHLGSCPGCRAETDRWRALRDAVVAESAASLGPVAVPLPVLSAPARRGRPTWRPARASAARAAVAAAALIVLLVAASAWLPAVRDSARALLRPAGDAAVTVALDEAATRIAGRGASGAGGPAGAAIAGRGATGPNGPAGAVITGGGGPTAIARRPTTVARLDRDVIGAGDVAGGARDSGAPAGAAVARAGRAPDGLGTPHAPSAGRTTPKPSPVGHPVGGATAPGTGPSGAPSAPPASSPAPGGTDRGSGSPHGPSPVAPPHEHPRASDVPPAPVTPSPVSPSGTPDTPLGPTVTPAPTRVALGVVTGRVVGGDGMGRAEVQVRAYPVGGGGAASPTTAVDGAGSDEPLPLATTDVTGAYTLSVPAGAWILGAEAPVFQAQWYPDRSEPFVAEAVAIAAGAVVGGVDFHLVASPSGGVSGRVTTPDGSPVIRAMVVGVHLADPTDPADPGDRRAVAFTGDDGRYDLFLWPGVYALTVHRDWRAETEVWWDGKATLPACDLLGIDADRLVEQIDFVLW